MPSCESERSIHCFQTLPISNAARVSGGERRTEPKPLILCARDRFPTTCCARMGPCDWNRSPSLFRVQARTLPLHQAYTVVPTIQDVVVFCTCSTKWLPLRERKSPSTCSFLLFSLLSLFVLHFSLQDILFTTVVLTRSSLIFPVFVTFCSYVHFDMELCI